MCTYIIYEYIKYIPFSNNPSALAPCLVPNECYLKVNAVCTSVVQLKLFVVPYHSLTHYSACDLLRGLDNCSLFIYLYFFRYSAHISVDKMS